MTDDPTRDIRPRTLERTDVLAPTRVLAGRYRLGRLLGEGGMGAVYEAEHIELGARLAVKLLGDDYLSDPTAARRFKREARAMAAIRHDNIVAVTDTGTDEGVPYIVMELLEGESLSALLKRERHLEPPIAVAIVCQVLAGVASAHDSGIIHRDLKPANIFMARNSDGEPLVKVLDFGVSKVAGDSETVLTVTGGVVGTPLYMSPEQIRGEQDIDGRADVYSVGLLLYRMVTGALPLRRVPAAERRARMLAGDIPAAREVAPHIPAELDAVIGRALAVRREDRFPDATAFREALAQAMPEAAGALSTATRDTSLPAMPPEDPSEPVRSPDPVVAGRGAWRRRLQVAGLALALGVAIAFASWWTLAGGRAGDGSAGPDSSLAIELGMTTYLPRAAQERIYGPIAAHLGRRLGRPVELAIYRDAEELARAFLGGEVDLAALNPVSYVRVKEGRPGIELLGMPVTAGGTSFEIHIVSKAGGAVEQLEDVRGRIFCYVPSAASGYLLPRDLLRQAGIHPDHDFAATRLAEDHLSALRHVASGRCDATAVYAGLLFELEEHGSTPFAFRILATSDRIPNDAYCAREGLPEELVTGAREALLELAPGSEVGAEVFPDGELVGFAPASDDAYTGIRQAVAREQASTASK